MTAADATQIKCPVLAIYGAEDKVSPQAVAETFVAELPRGELLAVDECGHWHPIEQPAAINTALDKQLRA